MIRGRAVREPPLRVVNNEGFSSMGAIYFHSNHGGGRPRGTPLRGLGKIRKWEGRCGQGGGGMGPRMREDNGRGRFRDGGGMGPVLVFTGAGSRAGTTGGTRGFHCGMTGYFDSNHARPPAHERRTPLHGGEMGRLRIAARTTVKEGEELLPGDEGWVPASARTTEGEGMGSVEEAPSAVGFVEGTRLCYCQTASRMPMTAYEIRG